MAALFRCKLNLATFRTLVLEAKRFTALMALEAGIVDGVGGIDEAMKILAENGVWEKMRMIGRKQVESGGKERTSYGALKEEMYRDIIAELDANAQSEANFVGKRRELRQKLEEDERRKVAEWSRGQMVRPKL